MKKIVSILFLSLLIASCSNDDGLGTEGPQGPPGEDGVNIVGISYEYEVEFDYDENQNVYLSRLEFPQTEEPSDAILVYRLETFNNFETWNLIPKSYFLDEGIIQISSNHTDEDVQLRIEGDYDLSNLSDTFTTDQYYRVVVVPSDFEQSANVDVSNMDAVLKALEIKDRDVLKMKSTSK